MNNLKPLQHLKPFTRFCCTIGELPSSYLVSLTYEEQLLWLCHFIKDTILPAINNNAEAVEELQKLYIELKNYVDHYFDNLDVQQEINNKLDEMAEDGTLASIINEQVFEQINNDITNIKKNMFYVNVVGHGIKNDGTDVTTDLQNLLNEYASTGATFYFKNGTYYFKNISIPSNCKILGDTNTKFIIPTNEEIACIFKLDNKENIEFENCYFQNGANVNGQGHFGSGIFIEDELKSCASFLDCNNISFYNCKFDTFFDGLKFKDTDNVTIEKCSFKNSGYSCIMLFSDCKNYLINNSLFDTIYSNLDNNNCYFIACTYTSRSDKTDILVPENITVSNCKFLNNPYWEGVDSHGSNNFTVENCYFKNVLNPIMLGNDTRHTSRHLKMHNLTISNNIFDGNNALGFGNVIINGDMYNSSDSFLINGVTITNNKWININNTSSQSNYPLSIIYCKNVNISGNVFNCIEGCLRLHYSLYGYVKNNTFNIRQATYFIRTYSSWLFYISENVFNNEQSYFKYIVNGDSTKNGLLIMLNNLTFYTSNIWTNNISSVSLFRCFGLPIFSDVYLQPLNKVISSKNIRTRIQITLKITATTVANSNIVNTSDFVLDQICPGCDITIKGAGADGADLNCTIVKYISRNQFKISTNALTSVSNAQIVTQTYTTQNINE